MLNCKKCGQELNPDDTHICRQSMPMLSDALDVAALLSSVYLAICFGVS